MNLCTTIRSDAFFNDNYHLLTSFNKTNVKHTYNTRLQKKIFEMGRITFFNDDLACICSILDNMKNEINGIEHLSNSANVQNIYIHFFDDRFYIQGPNIDLYSFLNNSTSIDLLQKVIYDARYPIDINNYLKIFETKYTLDLNNDDECCICMEKLKNKEDIVKTPCNHLFHKLCLKQWINDSKNDCPICRISF
jgi:hypothetical protein